MELFLHWEYLQDVYSSKKPELAAEQVYLQRLVNSVPGNTHSRGRTDAAKLKIAIAPYLGIGGNDGDDRCWTYTMKIGSRATVFREHWGLLAVVKTHSRHPSVRDISLAIYYNYIQPLWSDGSLSSQCRDFATSLAHGDTHIINICQDNPMGTIGLFGYTEPDQLLVPEMSGALPSTPPPPQKQGGPPTPPPTRQRNGYDDTAMARDDSGPDDRDVRSESSEEDRSFDDDDDEQNRTVQSSPYLRTRSRLQSGSPTPSTGSRAKRQRRR
ncbi:MAG: hypothetical protein Q9184_006398 [Pyrenodesmia sp. 2 TL-2023]